MQGSFLRDASQAAADLTKCMSASTDQLLWLVGTLTVKCAAHLAVITPEKLIYFDTPSYPLRAEQQQCPPLAVCRYRYR